MKPTNTTYLKILAAAGLALFTGFILVLLRNRGYFFPLFTNDYLMGHVVQGALDIPYEQYATGSAAATVVAVVRWACLAAMGLSGIICGTILAGARVPMPRLAKAILLAGAVAVVLIQIVPAVDYRNYLLLAEYAIILATPFLLWYLFGNLQAIPNTLLIQVAILLTFCSHGLFAIGFPFKTPAPFIDMIIHTTGVKEATARQMLQVAGVLDFVFAISLFFTPTGSRLKQFCLLYLMLWGFITAFGRIAGNYYADLGWYNVRQFLPEMLFRLPHGLLPLLLLVMNRRQNEKILPNKNAITNKLVPAIG